ncbi:MAG: HTTM domain-containing protein [Planctomycetaceae bacterium]
MNATQTASPGSGLAGRLNRFFYAEEVPYGLALLRMCLPVAVLVEMVPRWPFAREIYSSDGTPMPIWASYAAGHLYPAPPGALAVAMHSVLLFVLVTAMIGWRTRISLLTATVLYAGLTMLDAVSTLTKYTVIANHLLLLLGLSQCGAVWSIDNWLKRRRAIAAGASSASLIPARSSVWPRRLIQLLIAFVYFGAGITKIHTPTFFTGDQLHSWLMTDLHFHHPVGLRMAAYPAMLIVAAYVTITWEIVFIFLCWKGWARTLCLSVGAAFHLMTYFTLGLLIFPMVCIPVYLAFFDEHEYRRFGQWLAKSRILSRIGTAISAAGAGISLPHRAPAYSLAVFALLLVAVAGGGVQMEYLADRYGERRPEGKYMLKELDPEFVEGTLLRPISPIREVDKFGCLTLGTFMIGETVANNRTTFRIGETIIAQCGVTPPHEDLWVDIGLHDGDGRPIDTVGQAIPNESLRANCTFRLPESLSPGDYFIVVKSGGKEVLRRNFTLLPSKHATKALAN